MIFIVKIIQSFLNLSILNSTKNRHCDYYFFYNLMFTLYSTISAYRPELIWIENNFWRGWRLCIPIVNAKTFLCSLWNGALIDLGSVQPQQCILSITHQGHGYYNLKNCPLIMHIVIKYYKDTVDTKKTDLIVKCPVKPK